MKKRHFAALLFLSFGLLFLSVFTAFAGEYFSEEYYRVYDASGSISDEQRASLDGDCIAFLEKSGLDLALLALTEEELEGVTEKEYAEEFYELCELGWDGKKNGFAWVYHTESEKGVLVCLGEAEGKIEEDYLALVEEKAPELLAEHGVFGVLYGGFRYLSNYMEDHPAAFETAPAETEPVRAEQETETAADDGPSWYPADPKNFTFFHDEDAPRVVDAADIFRDEEEKQLEELTGAVRRALQRDVVIYTDKTDYGIEKDICAADFYDFNGYGYGKDREGMCLFICMDPADRGWWCCCTGPETMGLYTEGIANQMDDELFNYLSAGNYAEGVSRWIGQVHNLYEKGWPNAPEWYPAAGTEPERFHDPDAPRIVDELGLLSKEELAALTAKAEEISRKHGIDVVVHTMPSPVGMYYYDVARFYYLVKGYGLGENYDGICLTLFKKDGYLATVRTNAFGKVEEKLSEVNEERLRGYCEDKTDVKKYYDGIDKWLSLVDGMQRTGRVPRSVLYWVLVTLGGLVAGSVVGGALLLLAIGNMDLPVEKLTAGEYLDRDRSKIEDTGSTYLYTSTSRRYDPVQKRSSSGSSGSSYSSSYSGSSGSSHSGSGRSF